MRIASGGNVLVGSTVDNGYKFKVVGGNASQVLIDNDGSVYTQLLLQRNATSNTGGDILIDGTASTMNIRGLLAGAMTFQTALSAGSPVERMRIDSAGNVGIGTASPTVAKLHISGDLNSVYGIRLQSTRGTGRSYGFATVGTNADSLAIYDITGSEAILMNFSNTGAVALKGGVTTANGVGITFPATQSASSDPNTLDDYEEGTFTPTLGGSSGNPVYTASLAQGVYTKIGRVVQFSILIIVTGVSSQGSGVIFINGLPFNRASAVNTYATPQLIGYNDIWDTAFPSAFISSNYLVPQPTGVTQAAASWGTTSSSASNLSTGYLAISGTYITD
jgi:hypothetical protein